MTVVVLVVALLIAVVTLIFAIFNSNDVPVNLLFTQINPPLSLAIVVPFVAGLIVGVLVMVPGAIKSQITLVSHRRKLDKYEKAAAPETPPSQPPAKPDSSS